MANELPDIIVHSVIGEDGFRPIPGILFTPVEYSADAVSEHQYCKSAFCNFHGDKTPQLQIYPFP
jgi:hypothetical protein